MTFVLVGAGPTGVELAGSIAEMAAVTLRSVLVAQRRLRTRIVVEGLSALLQARFRRLNEA